MNTKTTRYGDNNWANLKMNEDGDTVEVEIVDIKGNVVDLRIYTGLEAQIVWDNFSN